MKTQHPFTFVLCAIVAVILSACGQQSKTENTVAESTLTVKAPEVDIHTAVVTGNRAVVEQYIASHGDLNVKDPFGGSSPLISAAVFGKTEIAKLLLDAGADINFQNNDGSTALHTAAFFCRPEIVTLLLEKNADKTIKNKYGATPYDNVAAPFAQMKDAYDMMGNALGPMGLKLDYVYIEKTRPEIAAVLK